MKAASFKLYFGTSNKNKFNEAKRILKPFKIELRFLGEKGIEIQSNNLEEISKSAAEYLTQRQKAPVIVEDAGLFIDSLEGFPGPYSAYVYDTIGSKGITKLMSDATERSASFVSAVAFCDPRSKPISFIGKVKGRIAEHSRGRGGFGFDPIFIPEEGDGRTFAQMQTHEKNLISHRSRAFRKFAQWYTTTRS